MANKPITVFKKTWERSWELYVLSNEANNEVHNDIRRAAVMFSVAGLDRYFTAKFCDVLVPRLKEGKKPSLELLNRLEAAGLDAEKALELMVSKRPFRKLRTIVQRSLEAHTTMRIDAIDQLFESMDLKNLSYNSSMKAGRPDLIRRVEMIVKLRHEIAHEAHVDSRGNAKPIEAGHTMRLLNDLSEFVLGCDLIINNRFGRLKAI